MNELALTLSQATCRHAYVQVTIHSFNLIPFPSAWPIMQTFATLFTIAAFLLSSAVNAASKDKPHTHQGVLKVRI